MRDVASPPMRMARQGNRWGLALGVALVSGAAVSWGCATGVDVTDEELAEICAESNTTCGGAAGSIGVGGSSSGSGLGGSSGGAGAFTANGGTGGSLGSSGSGGTFTANGGTGGSLGSSGSGGTSGSVPLAPGECLPTDDIVVLYRDRKAAEPSTNEPSMVLQVQNPGGTSFPLSDLAIRYWFTADGTSNFTANVDYATLNGQGSLGGINVSFGQEFGSDYAEITFSGTDTVGTDGIRELQLRFHAQPYAPLDQTNDFSYLSPATTATANRNITPYLRGSQVGGCVPSP